MFVLTRVGDRCTTCVGLGAPNFSPILGSSWVIMRLTLRQFSHIRLQRLFSHLPRTRLAKLGLRSSQS